MKAATRPITLPLSLISIHRVHLPSAWKLFLAGSNTASISLSSGQTQFLSSLYKVRARFKNAFFDALSFTSVIIIGIPNIKKAFGANAECFTNRIMYRQRLKIVVIVFVE